MAESPHPFGQMFSLPLDFAPGCITAWSGLVGSVPPGWFLCDGTHGTPDLRNEFLVSDGPNFSVDDEGGSAGHSHLFTGDGHFHTLPGGIDLPGPLPQGPQTTTDPATGNTDPSLSLPLYWALAFIKFGG